MDGAFESALSTCQPERQGLLAASDASKGCQEPGCPLDPWSEATLCEHRFSLVRIKEIQEHDGGQNLENS